MRRPNAVILSPRSDMRPSRVALAGKTKCAPSGSEKQSAIIAKLAGCKEDSNFEKREHASASKEAGACRLACSAGFKIAADALTISFGCAQRAVLPTCSDQARPLFFLAGGMTPVFRIDDEGLSLHNRSSRKISRIPISLVVARRPHSSLRLSQLHYIVVYERS